MRHVRLFDGLSEQEYERFLSAAKPECIVLSRDEVLVEEGEETSRFWIITAGRLKGARYHYDGSLDLVQVYTEGDIVNFDVAFTMNKRSPLHVSSVGASSLVAIDSAVFESNRISRDILDKLRRNIIHLLANESVKKQYKIDVLYQRSLRARIGVFLRHMSEKTGSDVFDVNMDREQFAQYLGVNRSALSHALSVMRKAGIIRFHKGHFEILDKEALDGKNDAL
ncbi:MAG: Crp/Fnr family transcriptional regulator [Clostridiales Family XIII bacterium]|jgi:CRP-like cAMP-binding protein|nr:Crp/Fnr family transcriptional regulator [Clostridiales Family XIII bacterium]